MFFRSIALTAILLSAGCVGRTIKDDPRHTIVPPGSDEVMKRSFAPALDEFIATLPFSSFEKMDRDYCGYYCPGMGVGIATNQIGCVEFETTLVHEVLHAIHFNGLVHKKRFAQALDRLRADPDYPDFVSDAPAIGWRKVVYFLFEQSEYFALVGEEIVRRRGINIPPYLWDIYRDILHPRLEENGHLFSQNPFPEYAEIQVRGSVLPRERLLKYALGLRAVADNVLPRTGVTGFGVILAIGVDDLTQQTATVHFRRRSTQRLVATCSATLFSRANGPPRIRCYLNPDQAKSILTAWIDHDLSIEPFDPVIAQHQR